MKLVVTGGGTGGHIFAGIALAQEFLAQSTGNQVLFIGSVFGLEKSLIPKSGYELKTIRVGKLKGQTWIQKLTTLMQLPFAVFTCLKYLWHFKADAVIGVGGYAAGPCILAARILHLPVGILEQNAVVGFTNRISAHLARTVFTAFEEPIEGIPKTKCIYTGNPTRSHLKPKGKSSDCFVIFAFGGSQGATGINQLMTQAARELCTEKAHFYIVHQTGTRDFDWVQKTYQEIGFPAKVYHFIDDMQSMYDQCSVVVCRAGSSTIAELGATQNAAIFIPYPAAAQNHQEKNARLCEKAGSAYVLLQNESSGDLLAKIFLALRNNPEKLAQMRKNMAQFHRPDASRRIVDVMITHMLRH